MPGPIVAFASYWARSRSRTETIARPKSPSAVKSPQGTCLALKPDMSLCRVLVRDSGQGLYSFLDANLPLDSFEVVWCPPGTSYETLVRRLRPEILVLAGLPLLNAGSTGEVDFARRESAGIVVIAVNDSAATPDSMRQAAACDCLIEGYRGGRPPTAEVLRAVHAFASTAGAHAHCG